MNRKYIVSAVAVVSLFTNAAFASGTLDIPAQSGAVAPMESATGTALTAAPSVLSVEVSKVDFVDSKTVTVAFNGALPSGVSPDSDVKLFRDMKVVSATKSLDDAKKVVVELQDDIVFDGSLYNLFSVAADEQSIDFTAVEGTTTYANPETASVIASVNVTAPKTLELTFTADVATPTLELKLLKETKKSNMFFDGANLNIALEQSLSPNTNYFFMFLSLKDESQKEVEVTNSMYDFVSPEVFSDTLIDQTLELNAGTGEVTASGLTVEQAATEVTNTPSTWAKTNLLIAVTFLLSIAYFVVRRRTQAE